MFESLLKDLSVKFRTCAEVQPLLEKICQKNPAVSSHLKLGQSEEGRDIDAFVLGNGSKVVSLIAGAHSDEPVGPETLRTFIYQTLKEKRQFSQLFSEYKFVIIPHINPDGEAKNQAWIKKWPDAVAYLQHVFRELPGRDLEFGFPEMRRENRLVANLFKKNAPISLHMSLHGMGVSDGILLLIEKHWIDRTIKLREQYAEVVQELGFRLHDHDRKGEKGFQYIGPGFTTTPEGSAMRAYFKSLGDEKMVHLFHNSSMEYVREFSGDSLCLVTEVPLFYIGREVPQSQPGVPQAYLDFKNEIPELRQKIARGEEIAEILREFSIKPVETNLAVRLQLKALELGLQTIQNNVPKKAS